MAEEGAERSWPDGMAPGTWVRVRISSSSTRMTPNDLLRAGWPNGRFEVLGRGLFDVPDIPKKLDCLVLWPCCNFCRNPATGQFLCSAHPARLFEPVPEAYAGEGDSPPPDGALAIGTLGRDVVNLSYYKDGKGAFIVRGFGKVPIRVEGRIAQMLGEAVKEIKVI